MATRRQPRAQGRGRTRQPAKAASAAALLAGRLLCWVHAAQHDRRFTSDPNDWATSFSDSAPVAPGLFVERDELSGWD